MPTRYWLRLLAAAFVWVASVAAPGLPLPGADRLGFTGAAAAQETIDIDTFYDELGPYGEWVWHPRYGYVWLPEDVSPRWRPYTVGRWTYTDEYGWYWDSNEPFAWAVYHYGRWGYDEDYGWFWVPGDTWAPAWVQWRYSDDYVGWAPVGPGARGYAYGVPVNYEPPIAESWVFVQPRYMTSRVISHYALPIGGLGVAFFGATNVYRPIYRSGIVYNYGMPRDRVVKIIRRPIYVQKVYRVDHWKGSKYDRDGRNKGINVYAPRFNKDGRNREPKKFVDNPRDFKPKAKLHDTFKGDVPKGWGKSAKGLTPIAKEDPEGFKKKGRFDGHDRDFGDRGKDKDRDKDKGQASKDFDRDGRDGKKDGGPPAPKLPPPVVKGSTGDQSKEKFGATGDRDGRGKDKDKDKDKSKGQASKDFDRDGNQNYLYLGWLRNDLLSGGGTLVRENEVSLAPHAGKEIVVELAGDQLLVRRIYLAEARVFWLTAQYPKSSAPSAEAQKFFDSFKITSVPKATRPPTTLVAVGPKTDPPPKTDPIPKVDPIPKIDPTPKTDPPVKPPVASFPIKPDEQALLDAINRFRQGEKVPPLLPIQRLFVGARSEADMLARTKQAGKQDGYGYRRYFRLTIPARGTIPAQELVDQIVQSKSTRVQLSDEEFDHIGIGIATAKDGSTFYMLLFCGGLEKAP